MQNGSVFSRLNGENDQTELSWIGTMLSKVTYSETEDLTLSRRDNQLLKKIVVKAASS